MHLFEKAMRDSAGLRSEETSEEEIVTKKSKVKIMVFILGGGKMLRTHDKKFNQMPNTCQCQGSGFWANTDQGRALYLEQREI